jgi:hypothetical protein
MRATIGILVVAYFTAAPFASGSEVVMSCTVEESGPHHARRVWELTFDQTNQMVHIANTSSTAAIDDRRITFRVDLGNGVPLNFAIDRSSGSIRVTDSAGSLYSGQCMLAEHPAGDHSGLKNSDFPMLAARTAL